MKVFRLPLVCSTYEHLFLHTYLTAFFFKGLDDRKWGVTLWFPKNARTNLRKQHDLENRILLSPFSSKKYVATIHRQYLATHICIYNRAFAK